MLNIAVPVFDLERSYKNVRCRKSLEEVLKKSLNLFSKLCRNPASCIVRVFEQLS